MKFFFIVETILLTCLFINIFKFINFGSLVIFIVGHLQMVKSCSWSLVIGHVKVLVNCHLLVKTQQLVTTVLVTESLAIFELVINLLVRKKLVIQSLAPP
jgi:hypothetical protein